MIQDASSATPQGLSSGTLEATILTSTLTGSSAQVGVVYERESSYKLTTKKWELRTPSFEANRTTLNKHALLHLSRSF